MRVRITWNGRQLCRVDLVLLLYIATAALGAAAAVIIIIRLAEV